MVIISACINEVELGFVTWTETFAERLCPRQEQDRPFMASDPASQIDHGKKRGRLKVRFRAMDGLAFIKNDLIHIREHTFS
jgi:hypothetical protein